MTTHSDQRYQQLCSWLQQHSPLPVQAIKPLCGDGSFRRYFRVHHPDSTSIAMDAPPQRENSQAYVAIANSWRALDIPVPELLCSDINNGFLLITDFGDHQLQSILNNDNANAIYQQAMHCLVDIQSCQSITNYTLPSFDIDFCQRELALFTDWYLPKYLQFELNVKQHNTLNDAFEVITEKVLLQPQICVHRDYHSRNIMWRKDQSLGLLDFQDAVWGPISYDLVSLLRDAYVDWPEHKVNEWALQYWQLATEKNILTAVSAEQFLSWFNWMGVQRHLKVLGIFARLCKRDGKTQYLTDMPRVWQYVLHETAQFSELNALHHFLRSVYESHVTGRRAR